MCVCVCVCVCVCLTLQLLQQEGLAAAPLGVQPHTDGRLHGRLAQDVGQGGAVQVVPQHVSVRLRGRQVTCGQRARARQPGGAAPARGREAEAVRAPKICVRMLFWWLQSML